MNPVGFAPLVLKLPDIISPKFTVTGDGSISQFCGTITVPLMETVATGVGLLTPEVEDI
ncbi:hypothetical protein D3C73_1540970 [compost metagenome]